MERLKKFLLLGASSLLLFCFPAFADELEASELPIEEVNHDVELVNDSTKEASDISIDNLAEIQGSMVKAPSLDPTGDYQVLGYYINAVDDHYVFGVYISGSPNNVRFSRINNEGVSAIGILNSPNYQININVGNLPYTIEYIINNDGSYIYVNKTLTSDGFSSFENIDVQLGGNSGNITTYLFNVGVIFSWLLSTIGILIGFILGNPFLAVSLLLFMAGTVISFYIRIKNS